MNHRFGRINAAVCRHFVLVAVLFALQASTSYGADVYNVNRLELRSSFNPIREIADNVIWEQSFDGSCNIVNVKVSQDDYPFSWETQFTTTLRATIGKCPPNPARDPDKVKWETLVRGQPDGRKLTGEATGTSTVDVQVKMPDTVGVFLVDLKFTIISGKCETKKTITRKLFVTIAKTVRAETGSENKRIWFEKACTWGSGASTKDAAVDRVRHGFYLNDGPIAIHYKDNPSRTWQELVEPTLTTRDGNCYVFSSVVKNMCRVLGVNDLGWDPYEGKFGKGFLTYTNPAPNNRSLDPGFLGNATPNPAASPIVFNRYRFANHSLMRRGNFYHDATYDGKYPKDGSDVKAREFVRCHVKVLGNPQETEDNDGARDFDVKRVPGVKSPRDWQAYHYKTPASPWLALNPVGGPDLASLNAVALGNPPAPLLSFSNQDSFYVIDEDFDGLGDALAADVSYLAPYSGDYSLVARLEYNGIFVTDRARFESQEPTYFDYTGPAGLIVAHFEFSGEEIFQKGFDGPLTLIVEALYDTVVLDTHSVQTPHFSHLDFGEFGVQFGSIADEAVDTDAPANGLADVLRAHVQIHVRRSGTYLLSGVLLADSVIITANQTSFSRSAGLHVIDLDLSGLAIRALNAAGPYELQLTLSGSDGDGITNLSHMTGSYSAPGFDLSDARINSINYVPQDTDGDTYYNLLRAELIVDSEESDSYTFIGSLQSTGGTIIASAAAEAVLGDQNAVVPLTFDGRLIHDSGEDGPYQLIVFVTDGDDTDWEQQFLSPVYLHEQFDGPCEVNYCATPIVVPGVTRYQHTGNTCCATNIISCIPRSGCANANNPDSCHCSGADLVYRITLLQAATVEIHVQGPDTSDEQLFVFTDCQNPTGSCVAAADEYEANSAGETLSLSLAAGTYFIAASHAGVEACGDLTLTLESDQPLPVELTGFEAIAGDGEVSLRWSTASESQNERFELERDGVLVARVPSQGNANGPHAYVWNDRGVQNGWTYRYELFAVEISGARQYLATASATPQAYESAVITEYALHQNYPNPFNPVTSISFDLPENGFVVLSVYNLAGQEVASVLSADLGAGAHTVRFDATGLPSGVYWYRLAVNQFVAEKKMLLLK